jgi:hypothetical protein
VPEFGAKAKDGPHPSRRQHPAGDRCDAGDRAQLDPLEQVKVEGGPQGIVVTRKGGEPSDWLCDLWLAERIASAQARRAVETGPRSPS